MTTHCGTVALLGLPNAGKSTLLNNMLGQKLAGVSRKPQTTRNQIIGIDTIGDNQLIFLDTPGIHRSKDQTQLNRLMNRQAWSSADGADVLCYLVDLGTGFTEHDERNLNGIMAKAGGKTLWVLATKADRFKKKQVAEAFKAIKARFAELKAALPEDPAGAITTASVCLSAKNPEDIAALRTELCNAVPEGPFLYPDDMVTDRSQNFVLTELIREQIFRNLGQEIPYGTSVKIESVEDSAHGCKVISAALIVNRASHKPILLGRGGSQIKKLSTLAREALESYFAGPKVYLRLFVQVSENWCDQAPLIEEFQYL